MEPYILKNYIINDLGHLIRDRPPGTDEEGKTKILEAYFNDVYKLFLGKLAKFEASTEVGDTDKTQLRSLLDEMINVKLLLVD